MEQTGSKLGKVYDKAVYCYPAYLIIFMVHQAKCWAGWIIGWNQVSRKKHQ